MSGGMGKRVEALPPPCNDQFMATERKQKTPWFINGILHFNNCNLRLLIALSANSQHKFANYLHDRIINAVIR